MNAINVNLSNVEVGARSLLLKLLTTANEGVLTVAEAVQAGKLFELSENSIRVSFARLTRSGLVEQVERGLYCLGSEAMRLGVDVASWRSIEENLTLWNGGWIAVATGGLQLSKRKEQRARTRALSMLGMVELDNKLFIRPNNFQEGVRGARDRLTNLGLDSDAAVFQVSDLDERREKKAMTLWDGEALAKMYQEQIISLSSWLEKAETLPLKIAARECYLLGDEAIRRIIFDPMLPAPLVDENGRHEFIEMTKRFDDVGVQIWAEFLSHIT